MKKIEYSLPELSNCTPQKSKITIKMPKKAIKMQKNYQNAKKKALYDIIRGKSHYSLLYSVIWQTQCDAQFANIQYQRTT